MLRGTSLGHKWSVLDFHAFCMGEEKSYFSGLVVSCVQGPESVRQSTADAL